MKLTIELDREADGRWIAEVPQLNILLYGASKQDAIEKAESAAREVVRDRIAHGGCLPILPTPFSTSPHERVAFVEGETGVRCAFANRLAA